MLRLTLNNFKRIKALTNPFQENFKHSFINFTSFSFSKRKRDPDPKDFMTAEEKARKIQEAHEEIEKDREEFLKEMVEKQEIEKQKNGKVVSQEELEIPPRDDEKKTTFQKIGSFFGYNKKKENVVEEEEEEEEKEDGEEVKEGIMDFPSESEVKELLGGVSSSQKLNELFNSMKLDKIEEEVKVEEVVVHKETILAKTSYEKLKDYIGVENNRDQVKFYANSRDFENLILPVLENLKNEFKLSSAFLKSIYVN
jgi:hypothetical protein